MGDVQDTGGSKTMSDADVELGPAGYVVVAFAAGQAHFSGEVARRGALNVLSGDGSIAEVYLTLIATTPLTGRALLWVLAPSALAPHRQPQPS